jgi:ethanolamine ammonia-lyase large subunit
MRSTCGKLLNLRPAPEFEQWLSRKHIIDGADGRRRLIPIPEHHRMLAPPPTPP